MSFTDKLICNKKEISYVILEIMIYRQNVIFRKQVFSRDLALLSHFFDLLLP